jgi:hypothetical protein
MQKKSTNRTNPTPIGAMATEDSAAETARNTKPLADQPAKDPTSYIDEMFSDDQAAFTRREIAKRTSNAVSIKSLANSDSLGEGIEGRFILGSKVMYPKANVVAWLKSRVRAVNSEPDEAA